MDTKHVNAMEVARAAGVSQSTVSRVFTPGASVSAKAREKVLKAANQLGYRPNALARGLIKKKTNMIGLVMGDIKNPFYPEILEKFTQGLQEKGFQVLFVQAANEEIQQEEITQFFEYNVAGVIVTDALLSSNVSSRLSEKGIPAVLFNRYTEDASCHYVCCDNFQAGKEIAEYLAERGHRRCAYIAGKANTSTSLERERGFREGLKERQQNCTVEHGNFTYEGGYQAVLRLLKKSSPPDAVFCGNDIMALGAVDAAKSLGIKLSVIGFDDISMASWPPYRLTTWQQPVDEMVLLTIQHLLSEMGNESKGPAAVMLKGKLVERDSVGAFTY
ncbi:LacI family DNA-binding transcriptional regulator [Metabacillus sp. GX 13764]|uniref:LacI family DNA-binding transcriptional regulator n=1 Tax=Metabacillus kandeliae TaxID=2900151 RepID=UPI001E44CD4C|nr:LacI family DNA-binding transcriptional regulator [Metabacillus kandeliae]MCD7035136.1 LacI family DNA-binding transcriptional regulator [Metabacillus kandeliae]